MRELSRPSLEERQNAVYLGIDIGGTTGRVAAFTTPNDLTELGREEFPIRNNFPKDLPALTEACERLSTRYGKIEAIGLAVAGKVNADRTQLTGAGNLTKWVGMHIPETVNAVLKCDVFLGNDAEAAALAEARYGLGKDQDFWFVIWGTGVGGCQIRQFRGKPIAIPGEVGHQNVCPTGDVMCKCGQRNCLEAYVGGGNIRGRYGKNAADLDHKSWLRIAEKMGTGLRNMVTTQPVPLVVFGGGIALKQPWLLGEISNLLARSLRIVEPPRLSLSYFGESAGTVGALALIDGI